MKNIKDFVFIGNSLIRYQSQLNLSNSDIDQSNENEEQLGLFKHFNIHEETQQRLKGLRNNSKKNDIYFSVEILARGVEYLFPVQYRSFNEIMSGKDCIVQARKNLFSKRFL